MTKSAPSSVAALIDYDITFGSNYDFVDFRRPPMRKAMRRIGRKIQARARKMVSRKAISEAGSYPGSSSGELRRAISFRVSRPGLMVIVQPKRTEAMADFYPAFLNYGTKVRERGGKLAARKNYIIEAAELEADYIKREIFVGMTKSIEEM